MRGIAGREKRYVEVVSATATDGTVTPLAVVWDTGKRYPIERVLDRRRARSLRSDSGGMRYTVSVGGTTTHLWYEGPRWFVEAKEAPLP